MSKKRILLVEDDKKLLLMNKLLLEEKGFLVDTVFTLVRAREALRNEMPDAMILDRGMPDGDGLAFLTDLRKTSRLPVLMLTGYKADADMIRGYDSGCDDYVTKPFSFEVLLRKLNTLLRRAEEVPDTIIKGGLTLKPISRDAFVNGADIELRPKEYSLLQYFVQNENRLISAEQIYEAVWGRPMAGDTGAVRTATSRLRSKLTGCGYTVTNDTGSYRFERGEP